MVRRLFSVTSFELSLRSRWQAGIFLLGIGLPALLLAALAVKIAVAATLGASTQISDLRRAVALDPANPKLHHWLGLVCAYPVEEVNPAEAVKHLRRATELNPNAGRYWLDLAKAYASVGETASADMALNHALELQPMSPRFRWAAANHYLLTERADLAFPQFRRLLELDPEYAWPIFRLCLKVSGDPQLVLEKVLPAGNDPKLKLAYVNFLSTNGEHEFAHRVWAKTVAGGAPFPFTLTQPYLERLLGLGRDDEAARIWKDLERLGIVPRPAATDADNLVFNGDFEQAPLNAGFDWRARPAAYVSVDLGDSSAYQGSRCLRVDFTVGQNDECEPVLQIVPVSPNQAYLLIAYVRSESITSDSGPRLRVLDLACPGCLNVSSETVVGTAPWHPLSLTFSTGAQTKLVRLSVWRARSRVFPTEITGQFWLDAVSLKAVGAALESASLKPTP
jgi:hypothetical protein